VQSYLPNLAEHFHTLRIPTDIFAANWFITMFSYDLSIDIVLSIMEVFLLEGKKSLIRFSLALLKHMEEKLLSMNDEECMEFLSHSSKELYLDSQKLIELAFSFKITNSLLSDLEMFYKMKKNTLMPNIMHSFSRLNLVEKEQKKLGHNRTELHRKGKVRRHWQILPATDEDIQRTVGKFQNLDEDKIHEFYQRQLNKRDLKDILEKF